MSAILVITDHRTHYPQESVYPICRALLERTEFDRVNIVSRGVPENARFFKGNGSTFLSQKINAQFQIGRWDWFSNLRLDEVRNYDAVFLRMDRPFDEEVARTLNHILRDCPRVLNNINGVMKTRLKSFVAGFDRFIPPSRVCSDANEIAEFLSEHSDIVVKLDDGYAAKGIVRVLNELVDGPDFTGTFSRYASDVLPRGPWPRVAVKFLKRISEGDKRLLIANGKLVSSILRIPKANQWLVNFAAGRSTAKSSPTPIEYEIIDYISGKMKGLGVFLYSIDTIEDDDGARVISEINSVNAGLLSIGDGENQDRDAKFVVEELTSVLFHEYGRGTNIS